MLILIQLELRCKSDEKSARS